MARSARRVQARGRPRLLRAVVAFVIGIGWLVLGAPAALADGPTTFNNTTTIAIPATGSANQTGPASPYPSPITVSGMAGAVTQVSVRFSGLTHSALNDIDAMVVAPGGANLVVLSDIGDPNTLAFANNATLTFADSGAGSVPTGNVSTGTYKPTNNGGGDAFPAPAPAPSSQTTLAGAFTGINPNGTWNLYAVDDTTGDTGTMSGGWSLIITTEVAADPTTTTVTTSGTPSTTGDSVTFTATVKAGGTAVTTGTVQFSDAGTPIGGPAALNAAGVATRATATLAEGTHELVATYSGATGFLASNGNVSQRVDNATTVTGNTFCNTGPLTFPAVGASQPYPSNVTVSGLGGRVTKVTATLKALSHTAPIDFDVMLAGPTPSRNVMLLSDVGGQNPVSNLTVTFDDDAASSVPTPITSGTFRPTDSDADSPDAAFPAPAPVVSSATALSTFDGISANGQWSLWAVDDASGDTGSITGGWCVTITSQVPTTTTVATAPNPSTFGQTVTFTATVATAGGPANQGSVQFTDGGSAIGGPVPVDGAGKATLTTAALAVGTHAIAGNYTGAGNLADSSGSASQVVAKAPTATGLTSSLNPSDVGQSVTFIATVTSGGSPVTAGTVQFSDGGGNLGAAVLVAADGTATFTTSALTAGTHSVTAGYAGTATLAASTSTALDQVVAKLVTATGLGTSLNPSQFGQSVTLTATVTSGGSPVTAGSVTFTDSGASIGAAVPVAADGTATLTTSALGVGTHPILATYSGTSTLATSSSDQLDQVVGLLATTTSLTSGPNPADVGQDVTFTATVSAAGAPVTSGAVQFSDGGTPIGGPVTMAADGTAELSTAGLAVGSHTITATFVGTAELATSTSSSVTQVVQLLTTTTVITSGTNPSEFGESVTFTAAISSSGTPLTSGTVQFSDGGTALGGPVSLAGDGTATFTTPDLSVGTHTIVATFAGTGNFATSAGSVAQVVTPATTTTTVTSSQNPSSVGQSVTFTATVTAGAIPVATGMLTFSVDGTVAATVDLDTDPPTYTTALLTAGSHIITASYVRNATFLDSDGGVDQVVTLVADAGGPYTVAEGESLTLDGSASSPGATYEWDINGDGVYGDASGPSPTLSWADLEALGIDDGPSSSDVTVEVSSGTATLDSSVATLTVTNTAPTSVITGSLAATVGRPFTVKVGALDPSSADLAADFTYTVDWGDGSPVETVVGPADPPVTHTYTTAGTLAASFTATDKDGGQGDPTVVSVLASDPATQTPTAPPSSSTSSPAGPTTSSTSSSDDDSLASTGSSIGPGPMVFGGALLVAGAAMLVAARRRRSSFGSHE